MNAKFLINRPLPVPIQALKNLSKCCYTTKAKNIVEGLDVEETPIYEVEPKFDIEEINRIRNKSRLWPKHYNILHGRKPYDESHEWYHETVWYKRKLLGKYGMEAAGVHAGICWPTKEDIEGKNEYENLVNPDSIQDLWKQFEEKKKEEALAIQNREKEIERIVANFDKWKKELKEKIEKKEAALIAAKQRKERMVQEIQEQFGYKIDPRDERFQEMLAKKEKEDKKKKKEEKKKLRAQKMQEYLAKKSQELNQQVGNQILDENPQSTSSATESPSEDKNKGDNKKLE